MEDVVFISIGIIFKIKKNIIQRKMEMAHFKGLVTVHNKQAD